jgi:hypothetical protein
MMKFWSGMLGCLIGASLGIAGGFEIADNWCRDAVFQEQIDFHSCRFRDVQINGSMVVDSSCTMPDGKIVWRRKL